MAPLHETVSSVENLAVLWLTVCSTTDQCWLYRVTHQCYLSRYSDVGWKKLVILQKVRKGEELKVPHHASAAATRDNHVPDSRQ